jgi:4-hydroxy-3-methylbut-2-en-1-yl diphosphate synthase IspG/GcpE
MYFFILKKTNKTSAFSAMTMSALIEAKVCKAYTLSKIVLSYFQTKIIKNIDSFNVHCYNIPCLLI